MVTVHAGKYFGFHGRAEKGSDNKLYMSFVVWYPVARNRLGYLYPSFRIYTPREYVHCGLLIASVVVLTAVVLKFI